MNKQSSIEWICERLALKLGVPVAISFYIDHAEEIAEAKAMHKEEIKTAFSKGEFNSVDYFNPETKIEECEQYYNQTFNK